MTASVNSPLKRLLRAAAISTPLLVAGTVIALDQRSNAPKQPFPDLEMDGSIDLPGMPHSIDLKAVKSDYYLSYTPAFNKEGPSVSVFQYGGSDLGTDCQTFKPGEAFFDVRGAMGPNNTIEVPAAYKSLSALGVAMSKIDPKATSQQQIRAVAAALIPVVQDCKLGEVRRNPLPLGKPFKSPFNGAIVN